MTIEAMCEAAKAVGFTHAAPLKVATLELKQEVRDMCEANTCGMYNKRWSCPPGCGEIGQLRQRLKEYSDGILIQTVGYLEDDFDGETMMQTEEDHKQQLLDLQKLLLADDPNVLILGAGCCTHCKECTYPDAPCRFPEKQVASMEAYGMLVQEVCKANDVKYYYGPQTIAFTSCVLKK